MLPFMPLLLSLVLPTSDNFLLRNCCLRAAPNLCSPACLQVRVWDAVTGEQVKKMGEHKDIVNRWAVGVGSGWVGFEEGAAAVHCAAVLHRAPLCGSDTRICTASPTPALPAPPQSTSTAAARCGEARRWW